MGKVAGISIALVAMVLFLPMISQVLKNNEKLLKETKRGLLIIYGGIYLFLTLLSREPFEQPNIELQPLWSYVLAANGATDLCEEIALNILLYIPLGYLLCFLGMQWKKSLTICTGISVLTEVLQYLTCLGVCEIDDLINNTGGAVLGIGLFYLDRRNRKR